MLPKIGSFSHVNICMVSASATDAQTSAELAAWQGTQVRTALPIGNHPQWNPTMRDFIRPSLAQRSYVRQPYLIKGYKRN